MLVEKALYELESSSCIQVEQDSTTIPQTLGRIASFYYLNHKTMRMFREELTADTNMEQILKILSNATEYDELPVRHNEDQLNSDLAKKIPLEVDAHSYDSSNTKTFILFQAHFCRLQLPTTDYLTDTKSVMDQAIRILQGMLDAVADEGWLVTSLRIIQMIQMVIQARWVYDSSLLTLPYIQPYHLYSFRPKSGKKHLRHIKTQLETLPELISVCHGKFEVLNDFLGEDLNASQIDQIYDTLQRLPQIEVQLSLRGWWEGGSGQEETRPVSTEYRGGVRGEDSWIQVHADQEYVLNVRLNRINRTKKKDRKAIAPNFPKPKDEGWFLVVGEVDSKDLIALKRVPYVHGLSNVQLAMYTPIQTGRVIYTLYLMSDSYLGLDQQYDVCLDVIPASIETQVNTELMLELEGLDLDE